MATIAINGTGELLNFGTRPIAQGCDIFQLCMRVHASPAQAKADAFQAYIARKFPLLLVEPDFADSDRPLYPIQDRPMRTGSAALWLGVMLCHTNCMCPLVARQLGVCCATLVARVAHLRSIIPGKGCMC